MAASPLSPLRPAVFRSPTPNGWSHVKKPAEAPIELLTARLRLSRQVTPAAKHATVISAHHNFLHGGKSHLGRTRARRCRDPARSGSRSGSSSPRSRRLRPAPPPQRAVLTSARLLFMTRFARCATTHKPWPMAVPGLLFTKKIGGAPSHHQRQLIPRKIPPPSQVLVRAAACTPRDATTQDRHSAARREHQHPHRRLSNLHSLCVSEQHDR